MAKTVTKDPAKIEGITKQDPDCIRLFQQLRSGIHIFRRIERVRNRGRIQLTLHTDFVVPPSKFSAYGAT